MSVFRTISKEARLEKNQQLVERILSNFDKKDKSILSTTFLVSREDILKMCSEFERMGDFFKHPITAIRQSICHEDEHFGFQCIGISYKYPFYSYDCQNADYNFTVVTSVAYRHEISRGHSLEVSLSSLKYEFNEYIVIGGEHISSGFDNRWHTLVFAYFLLYKEYVREEEEEAEKLRQRGSKMMTPRSLYRFCDIVITH
jgi:hypothetical protein